MELVITVSLIIGAIVAIGPGTIVAIGRFGNKWFA